MFDGQKKIKIEEVDLSSLLPRYNDDEYVSRYMGYVFDPNFRMRILLRICPQFYAYWYMRLRLQRYI